MIQGVNQGVNQRVNGFISKSGLRPRTIFRGNDSGEVNCKGGKIPKAPVGLNRAFEKKLAVLNAGGISAAAGVVTTVIARSYTATWKNAGLFGLGAGFITMMFICPKLLYKSGFNILKPSQSKVA